MAPAVAAVGGDPLNLPSRWCKWKRTRHSSTPNNLTKRGAHSPLLFDRHPAQSVIPSQKTRSAPAVCAAAKGLGSETVAVKPERPRTGDGAGRVRIPARPGRACRSWREEAFHPIAYGLCSLVSSQYCKANADPATAVHPRPRSRRWQDVGCASDPLFAALIIRPPDLAVSLLADLCRHLPPFLGRH